MVTSPPPARETGPVPSLEGPNPPPPDATMADAVMADAVSEPLLYDQIYECILHRQYYLARKFLTAS